ncbi:MAG TPA: hypothetical protein VJH21_01815 [Candidatus Paceibacterota bacterium]
MERKKYILIVIITPLVLVALGVGVYLFFHNGNPIPQIARVFFPQDVPANTPVDTNEPVGFSNDMTVFEEINDGGEPLALHKVSSSPVAGAVIVESGANTFVRYLERETGHIFDAPTTTFVPVRITNTTIPRIRNSVWTTDGLHVAIQYLDENLETIETFLGSVPVGNSSSDGELQGTFLPENTTSIATNKTGTEFAYVGQHQTGSQGVRITPTGATIANVFSSPLSEWKIFYGKDSSISLLSKPSAYISGFLYKINKGAVFDRLLGGIPGLTTLENADGTYVAFSRSEGNGVIFSILDEKQSLVFETPLATFPEKCVWQTDNTAILYCLVPHTIPSGPYPDMWYQGLVSFNDVLWKIDAQKETYTKLVDLSTATKEEIDGVSLSISSDNTTLIFSNKKDSSLWSLALPPSPNTELDTSVR